MQATERLRRIARLSWAVPGPLPLWPPCCEGEVLRRPPCVMPWWHCHSEMAAHAYLHPSQKALGNLDRLIYPHRYMLTKASSTAPGFLDNDGPLRHNDRRAKGKVCS